MQVWHDLRFGTLEVKGHEDKVSKMVALVAQSEHGDQTSNLYQHQIYTAFITALLGTHVENLADYIDSVSQVSFLVVIVVYN